MSSPTTAYRRLGQWIVLLAAFLAAASASAKTTVATNSGNWTVTAIWDNGDPAAGDDVVINLGKTVTLSSSTPYLASFTNSGTLVFTNWDTTLSATNITLVTGTVTHAKCYATSNYPGVTDAATTPIFSNRVVMICSNLTILTGATLNVNDVGYGPMGPGTKYTGSRGGGGYGGLGGRNPGQTYGDPAAPGQPGSGGQGQSYANTGTAYGGGCVRIDASGRVTVDGIITANGKNSVNGDCGGGSGGGILITCDTFTGSGRVMADGGAGWPPGYGGSDPGGGGGGRIAVIYNTANQAATPRSSVAFSSRCGVPTHPTPSFSGTIGTLHFPDDQLMPQLTDDRFNGILDGFSSWHGTNILMSNSLILFADADFAITATNDILFKRPVSYTHRPVATLSKLTAGRHIDLDLTPVTLTNSPSLECGGDFSLINTTTNLMALAIYAGPTNAGGPDYGSFVGVTGSVTVASNWWIYPYSYGSNGGSVLFRMRNLSIPSSAGINANAKGFWPSGPGTYPAGSRGGAGYGGLGGTGFGGALAGPTYGSSNAPITPGSAGQGQSASYGGGAGGGTIRIETERTLILNGVLAASGAVGGPDAGGGSGGGIYLISRWFRGGASASIQARGANANNTVNAGDGGGGRIAVSWGLSTNDWQGDLTTNSVLRGTNRPASAAGNGTLVWQQVATTPLIDNLPVSNLSYVTATLVGSLVSTGSAAPTDVAVYWGTTDQGTEKDAWTFTNTFAGPYTDGQTLTADLTGLVDGQTYSYRFYASNSVGDYWSAPAESFRTLPGIPTISNDGGASNITFTTADVHGYLLATGTAATAVELLWGPADGGTNRSAWANTNAFLGYQSIGPLVTNIDIPASNSFYYYTHYATNAGGDAWATPSELFMSGEVWLETTTANALEADEVPGTVTVCRVSTATNLALTVHLGVSGTADPGTDYSLIPAGPDVVLSAGVDRVSISVRAVWDSTNDPGETVVLTLLPGGYIAGTPSNATVTIINDAITPDYNTTTANGDWNSPAVWSLGRRPIAGDVVVITNRITLTNSTEQLSVVTNRGTLTFNNWSACLAADTVVLATGTLTHAAGYGTNEIPLISNRVYIVCGDFTLDAGASINVDTNGYYPFGPGTLTSLGVSRRGGSYGGVGYNGAATYGSPSEPLDPGSAGCYQSGPGSGGKPGGAVRIVASGPVTLNGLITANGNVGLQDSGGGSGGGVYITGDSIAGTGTIRANGGRPDNTSGGGGGGGRIALEYNPGSQSAVTPKPALTLSAAGGAPNWTQGGALGTLHVTDAQVLPENMSSNFNGVIWNLPSWSPSNLVCSGLVQFAVANMELAVSNHASFTIHPAYAQKPPITLARFSSGGSLTLDKQPLILTSNPVLTCGQDLIMTNSATLNVYPSPTNNSVTTGASIRVDGVFFLDTNCWVYPWSDPTNGASVQFATRHLTISSNAGFSANTAGYIARYNTSGLGPGAGTVNGTGGGYGGMGGRNGVGGGGNTYGSAEAPTEPGSAGHSQNNATSARAGGSIQIVASGTVRLDGTLRAIGGNAAIYCGGGSGGSIYLTCKKLIGSPTGALQANGGTVASPGWWGCGGGGGRIAVWRVTDINGEGTVTAVATGGVGSVGGSVPGYNGADGTVFWGWLPSGGTVFVIR